MNYVHTYANEIETAFMIFTNCTEKLEFLNIWF